MSNISPEIAGHLLRPTDKEIRNTRVWYHHKNPNEMFEAPERLASLRSFGFTVTPLHEIGQLLGEHDYDFIFQPHVEEPFSGHEVLLPALAAFQGIACLGPPAPTWAISEDKVLGKAMAASIGLEVARHRLVNPREPGVANLYPPGRWVLKPRTGVMSASVGYIDDAASWRRTITQAAHPLHEGREFLAEEFVPGLNIAVPVIEGFPPRSLSAFLEHGEARNNILTRSGKEGQTADYASEPYNGPGAAQAVAAAAKLAAAISPFDYARLDFRYEPVANRLVFLEVNLICAMGPFSVVGQAAALHGIDHKALIGHIFAHSLRRQRKAA
jgi:D-alanine-D-alanine ligase